MKHLEKLARKHLGEILVDEGLISKSQLVDAEREHHRTGDPLGAILVEASYLTDWDLAKTVAMQYQLPYVELHTISRTKDTDGIFSPGELQKHRFVPIDRIGNVLTMAVADMPDIEFLRSIQERSGLVPFLFVTLLTDIQKVLLEESAVSAPAEAQAEPDAAATEAGDTAAEPEELTEGDWQEGLSIFDQSMDGDEPEAEEAPVEEIVGEEQMDGWQNIFDEADQSVLKEIDGN